MSKERLKKRSGISWKGFIVMGCELEKRRIIGSILCNPHVKWLYAGLKNGSIFRCPCGKVERQAKNIRAAEAAWVPQPAKRQKAASLKSLWAPYPFGTVRKPCEGIVGGMRCIHKAIPCLLEAMRDTQLKLKPSSAPWISQGFFDKTKQPCSCGRTVAARRLLRQVLCYQL